MKRDCRGCFGASFNDCGEACSMVDALFMGSDQTHFTYGHMYRLLITDEDDYTIVDVNGIQYRYESYDGLSRDWKLFK